MLSPCVSRAISPAIPFALELMLILCCCALGNAAYAAASPPERRTTYAGLVFERDTSNPQMGESWLDPSRTLIWGDALQDDQGRVSLLDLRDANRRCASIGARLPTRSEFLRLSRDLGAKGGPYDDIDGYRPQILPNLQYWEHGSQTSYFFWASDAHKDYKDYGYIFRARFGDIMTLGKDITDGSAARCVLDRKAP